MSTHVVTRTGHTAHRYHIAVALSVLVVLAGLGMAKADIELAIAVSCVGLAGAAWSLAALDEARTLARLADRHLGELAIPLPVLPSVSTEPHRDVAWLPAGIPAVVAMPEGGWGLIPHDTAEGAIHRDGFNGRWYSVAEPCQVYDPATPTPQIGRIPRDSAAVLVDHWPTPLGVTGETIRSAARGRAIEGARQ
ncbi:MAG: hypothetical protein ACR2HR_03080 [Euzebya sp.]